MNDSRQKIIIVLLLLLIVAALYERQEWFFPDREQSGQIAGDQLAKAFADRLSNVQVEGRGVVQGLLPDDRSGSRHQRFILRLGGGQTILVAHNIDLSPRIDTLGLGDTVEFYGEYEWNEKGGVVHWTHRDPAGKHPDGWLKHNGRVYR